MIDYENEGKAPGGEKRGRQVRARNRHEACGICGRTILVGEDVDFYAITPGEEPVRVCFTCRQRAEDGGFRKLD